MPMALPDSITFRDERSSPPKCHRSNGAPDVGLERHGVSATIQDWSRRKLCSVKDSKVEPLPELLPQTMSAESLAMNNSTPASAAAGQPAQAAKLAALGVVFGDLGTSPLYTLQTVVQAIGGQFTPS